MYASFLSRLVSDRGLERTAQRLWETRVQKGRIRSFDLIYLHKQRHCMALHGFYREWEWERQVLPGRYSGDAHLRLTSPRTHGGQRNEPLNHSSFLPLLYFVAQRNYSVHRRKALLFSWIRTDNMSANKRLLPSGVASPSSCSTSTSFSSSDPPAAAAPAPPKPSLFAGFFTSGGAAGCGPLAAGQLS